MTLPEALPHAYGGEGSSKGIDIQVITVHREETQSDNISAAAGARGMERSRLDGSAPADALAGQPALGASFSALSTLRKSLYLPLLERYT